MILYRTLLAVAFLAIAAPAPAAFVVFIPTPPPAYGGSSGNGFDVALFNNSTAPAGPYSIDSYNVELTLPANAGLTFTGVTAATLSPYLFAGNSLGIVSSLSMNGTQIDWNDLSATMPALVASGQTFGLGHVSYNAASTAPLGPVTVTIDGITTIVQYPTFTAIPYSTGNSILTVSSPAPPSALMFAGGLLLAAGRTLRRRDPA